MYAEQDFLNKHTKEEIKNRLKYIDWVQYKLPHGTPKDELIAIGRASKFGYNKDDEETFFNNLVSQKRIYAGILVIPIFIFHPSYEYFNKDESFYITCLRMVEKIKDIFFFNEELIKREDIFNAIDNEDGTKNIFKSNNLRAIKYKILYCFYNDTVNYFL